MRENLVCRASGGAAFPILQKGLSGRPCGRLGRLDKFSSLMEPLRHLPRAAIAGPPFPKDECVRVDHWEPLVRRKRTTLSPAPVRVGKTLSPQRCTAPLPPLLQGDHAAARNETTGVARYRLHYMELKVRGFRSCSTNLIPVE